MRVLLISTMLASSLAAADPKIENGLYHIQDSGGITVKSMKSGEVHLGKKLDDKIEKALVLSLNNDNTQYYVSLTAKDGFSEAPWTTGLCVDGECLPFNSGGQNGQNAKPKLYDEIGAEWVPKVAADAVAKHLGVKPLVRHHPHHELLVKFVPGKEGFKVGEPLPVKLTIKNVGSNPFTFQVGGKFCAGRDNQFGFKAHSDHSIPDIGSSNGAGSCFEASRTVKPGESFEAEVDLGKWFKLEEPGTYTITGIYSMEFHDPDSKDRFTIWEDYATAEFYLTIEK